MSESIDTLRPEVVLAAYTGSDALAFLDLRPGFQTAHLVTSGLFFSPSALRSRLAAGAFHASPWSAATGRGDATMARTLGGEAGRQLANVVATGHASWADVRVVRVTGRGVEHAAVISWDSAAQHAESEIARSLKTGWTTPYLELMAEA